MNFDNWIPEIGMEVFIVPNYKRDKPYKAKIEKVGRKYFHTYRSRFFISTKNEESGEYDSQSHCYRSEGDYKRKIELDKKRHDIAHSVDRLTDEQVDKVYEWIMTNHKN